LGIATARLGGGTLTSVRNDVSGYWSNALGLGVDEPLTAALIDEAVDFFTAHGNLGATILIAPDRLPADWAAICERHSLRTTYGRNQHICSLDGFSADASTDLDVRPVADAKQWARFVLTEFGMTDENLVTMVAPGYGSDDFQLFAAWDDDQMVAGGCLFVWEDVAVLNTTATQSSHRNRGAQSALIAARAAAAAKAGCRWLVTQTGQPEPGQKNPSLDNMVRTGLPPLYTRPVWTWGTPDATVD
jgi:hypothetical protein